MEEVPKFSLIGGTRPAVTAVWVSPPPAMWLSARELGAMMAREVVQLTRLALVRRAPVESLVDLDRICPEYPGVPTLPEWAPAAPDDDAGWLRDYHRGMAGVLKWADGAAAETPTVVEAYERACRAVESPHVLATAAPAA